MSSILKALKKIEEDSAPPPSYPSLVTPIDTKQALNSAPKNRWRFRRYLKFIYILLVMAVALTILISQRRVIMAKVKSALASVTQKTTVSPSPPSEKPRTFQAKVPRAPAKTTTASSIKTRRRDMPAKSPLKPPISGSNQQNIQANTKSNAKVSRAGRRNVQADASKRKPKTEILAKARKPRQNPIPPSNSASTAKSAAVKRPSAAKAKVKAAPTTTYARLKDSKLKLQALAWSDDAARRMAVINDRIVYEGDSVDGFQVTKIRQEDVIVNSGGKSWRLVFGLHQ